MARKFTFEPTNRGATDKQIAPPKDLEVIIDATVQPTRPPPPLAKQVGTKPAAPSKVAGFKPPEDNEPYVVSVAKWGPAWIIVNLSNHRQQRRTGGTVAWRYNNPGNIKYGPFAQAAGAVGKGHADLCVFPTYQAGHEAMKRLLFSGERTYANMSIWDAIHKYAPPEDNNNSEAYARQVAAATGVKTSTILNTLSEYQRDQLIEAMKKVEGYRAGQVLPV